MQSLVKKIAEGVKDMSRNLHLDTGASVDAEAIVRKAEQAMIEMASNPAGGAGQTLENLLVDADQYDPLTGAVGRVGFDKALRNGFELSRKNNEALTLVQIGVDGLRNTAMKIGASAGDETINSCVMLMRKHFAPLGGVVCTLGGDIYAMVIYGANAKDAQRAAEEFRFSFEKAVVTWPLGGGTLKVSMGVASNDPGAGSTFASVQELVVSAVTALKTARAGDGRGIVVAAPRKAAA
jgi:diguanylate cyclase (GGDEF)-like protein